jgi:hypothetical protein
MCVLPPARAVGGAVAQFQRSNEQRKWLVVQEQG